VEYRTKYAEQAHARPPAARSTGREEVVGARR